LSDVLVADLSGELMIAKSSLTRRNRLKAGGR
jgi:hypothetical protein